MVIKDMDSHAFGHLLFKYFRKLTAGFIITEYIKFKAYQLPCFFDGLEYVMKEILVLPEKGDFIPVGKCGSINSLYVLFSERRMGVENLHNKMIA